MKNLNFMVTILFLHILLLTSCQNPFPLDSLFEEIKIQTKNPSIIDDFKNLSLDSAIINYEQYPEIFVNAVAVALEDSTNKKIYLEFLKNNEINRYNKFDGYLVIAVFHQRLNKKRIDLDNLRKTIYKVSPYDYPPPLDSLNYDGIK